MSRNYAYVRVSTKEQNTDRQFIVLQELNIPKKNIYVDKQSGKDFRRARYLKMVKRLQKDDVLYVKSIDRLGRNCHDIIEQWRYLTRDKRIDIVVLDMPLLDTRKGKDLLGTFISDIVLQLLSFVAENERVNIRQRQAEGIAVAKARGVIFGRPIKPITENFQEMREKWLNRELTLTVAASRCNMPRSTFYSKAKQPIIRTLDK